MRPALALDHRCLGARGALPDPRLCKPGFGVTGDVFLAVVALVQGIVVEPMLLLAGPQAISDRGKRSLYPMLAWAASLRDRWFSPQVLLGYGAGYLVLAP